MTGAVHAAIGAALGSLLKKRKLAFAAGVISHAIADSVPHKDYSVKVELALLAASMTTIAMRYGLDSPEFSGALGAISPDFEHGLSTFGIMPEDCKVFPTHINYGKYHGRESSERVSQLVVTIVSVVVAEMGRLNSRPK